MKELVLGNRQRVRRLNGRFLRRVAAALLDDLLGLPEYEIGIHLVDAKAMARINSQYLGHEGSTDVITFDHAETPGQDGLHGELFISLSDAVAQARPFKTTWQSEVVRYLVHGILHLLGHDDRQRDHRRVMKLEENRLFRLLARRFAFEELERRDSVTVLKGA